MHKDYKTRKQSIRFRQQYAGCQLFKELSPVLFPTPYQRPEAQNVIAKYLTCTAYFESDMVPSPWINFLILSFLPLF